MINWCPMPGMPGRIVKNRSHSSALLYPPYGYDWDGEQMVINPEQAAVVKEIFAALLSGKGSHAIADDLNPFVAGTARRSFM